MKERIRHFAANLPILSALAARAGARGAPIFMLHRVLPAGARWSDAGMVTSTELFDAFLGFIVERYRPLPLEDLALRADEWGKSERRPCAVTFDDGWLDTYTNAFPLLKKHSVPATVFLPAHFIGTARYFWQDRLWLMLRETSVRAITDELAARASREFGWSPVPDIGAAHLQDFLAAKPSSEAEAFVDWMERETRSKPPAERVFMSWDEAREMRAGGVRFGSHSCNHVMLDLIPVEDARREIEQSRREIEAALGERITSFCYPWRLRGESIPGLVRDAGYLVAVTSRSATVPRRPDPYRLPRVGICSASLANRHGSFGRNEINFQLARAVTRSCLR